jgi:hypothetical protein
VSTTAITVPIGAVEIWLEAGGDLVRTPNGDILLAYDSSATVDATTQRLYRLLDTIAMDVANGVAPGDLFNPTWGASEPLIVDQMVTGNLVPNLTARIRSGLLSDPSVAQVNSLDVGVEGTQVVLNSANLTAVNGENFTIGPYPN